MVTAAQATTPTAAWHEHDLFAVVRVGPGAYEVSTIRSATSVRLVALSRREARLRRIGGWLERHGIRL